MNITFNELLKQPFEREYKSEVVLDNTKTVGAKSIKLYVEDNKLNLELKEKTEQYILEEKIFLIKFFIKFTSRINKRIGKNSIFIE